MTISHKTKMQSTVTSCECVHFDSENGTSFVKWESKERCRRKSVHTTDEEVLKGAFDVGKGGFLPSSSCEMPIEVSIQYLLSTLQLLYLMLPNSSLKQAVSLHFSPPTRN